MQIRGKRQPEMSATPEPAARSSFGDGQTRVARLVPLIGAGAHIGAALADCDIQKHTLDMITALTPDCLCSALLDSDRMDDKFQREVLERLKAMGSGSLLSTRASTGYKTHMPDLACIFEDCGYVRRCG